MARIELSRLAEGSVAIGAVWRPALCLLLSLVSLVCLLSAASHLRDARQESRRLGMTLAQLKSSANNGQELQKLTLLAEQVVQRFENLELSAEQWVERSVALKSAKKTRAEVAALLESTGRHSARLFGAAEYEVAVTDAQQDLFKLAGGDSADLPLSVMVRGKSIIRTVGYPQ